MQHENKGIPNTKRTMDLFLAFLFVLIFWPVFAVIAISVWIFIGSPVLFKQTRPGYAGRSFGVYKFRSMNEKKDDQGMLLPDEERITRLGRILRRSSLDELPELINVFIGEMSLVGPRPLLMQYLSRYSPEQFRRHQVLPGITGWAQVNGRNNLSWEEKFKLDVWYVDHWSMALDMKILWMTIWKVLSREGINQPGHATSEEFMGNSPESGDP
jgi:sugar transferase EpsL